jgi:hypothetical protein
LRLSFLPFYDRGVADVHYQLAQAAEYAANEPAADEDNQGGGDGGDGSGGGGSGGGAAVETAAQESLRQKSLHHYECCCAVFQALAAHLQGGAAGHAASAPAALGAANLQPKGEPLVGASAAAPLALDVGLLSAEDAAELAEVQVCASRGAQPASERKIV